MIVCDVCSEVKPMQEQFDRQERSRQPFVGSFQTEVLKTNYLNGSLNSSY